MPYIHAVSSIDFLHKIEQSQVKALAHDLFAPTFPQIDKLLDIFDNTEIESRNFCKPLEDYALLNSFEERNQEYIRITLEASVQAIEDCLKKCATTKEAITDIIFISSTGLATPSMDALIINHMHLNPHTNRTPVFGLGCGGGVSGMAKANMAAVANPEAVALLVAVELCSLTFLKNDFSKSNFVASSLFSDGVAACIIKGDAHAANQQTQIRYKAAESKLYYDSLDVMGWEFLDSGFKVIFSQDIPTIIHKNVREDVTSFLAKQQLQLSDIKNFIFHPGGKKVLTAYSEALTMPGDFLKQTRTIMNQNGNMSSATVLYVLQNFMEQGFENGYGLMMALGPGFSCEMVLLDMQNPI